MAKWKSLRGKIDPRIKHDEAQCTGRQTRVISAGFLELPVSRPRTGVQLFAEHQFSHSPYLCLSPGVSAARMGLLGGMAPDAV